MASFGEAVAGGCWIDSCTSGTRFDPEDWSLHTLESLQAKYAGRRSAQEVVDHWQSTCEAVAGFAPRDADERRIDPADGEAYSFEQIRGRYADKLDGTELQGYWDSKCSVAYPDDETTEQRYDPDDGKPYTLAQLRIKFRTTYSTPQIEKYWELSCKPEEPSEDEDELGIDDNQAEPEQRVDPNDRKTYTMASLRERYKEFFSVEEIEKYWQSDCRPTPSSPDEPGPIVCGQSQVEKRFDPHDNKGRTLAELRRKYAGAFSEVDIRSYWQGQCKEKKVDPDDKKKYTYARLRRKYLDSFPEEDIEAYWAKNCCTKAEWSRKLHAGEQQLTGMLPRYRFAMEEETVDIVYDGGRLDHATYVLLRPHNFSAYDKWPLLIWVPGNGEAEREGWMLEMVELVRANRFARKNFIIVVPIVFRSASLVIYDRWKVVNQDSLWCLMQHAARSVADNVDVERVYITGFSMGAEACLRLGIHRGGALAAVAPIAGSYDSVWPMLEERGARSRLADLPIRMFHSLADEYISASGAKGIMEAIVAGSGQGAPQNRRISVRVPPPGAQERDHDEKVDATLDGQARSGGAFVYTYAGLEVVPIDVTLYAGGSKELWLFPGKGHCFSRHPIWTATYRCEDEFALFRWLLRHQRQGAGSAGLLAESTADGRA